MVSAPMIGIFHYLMDTLILDTLNQMIETNLVRHIRQSAHQNLSWLSILQ